MSEKAFSDLGMTSGVRALPLIVTSDRHQAEQAAVAAAAADLRHVGDTSRDPPCEINASGGPASGPDGPWPSWTILRPKTSLSSAPSAAPTCPSALTATAEQSCGASQHSLSLSVIT